MSEHGFTDEDIERAARAIYENGDGYDTGTSFDNPHLKQFRRDQAMRQARAALSAVRPVATESLEVPGWTDRVEVRLTGDEWRARLIGNRQLFGWQRLTGDTSRDSLEGDGRSTLDAAIRAAVATAKGEQP